jgi:hypothetical protein
MLGSLKLLNEFQYNTARLWREEQRLRMSEKRVVGRIFGPKRDEIVRG